MKHTASATVVFLLFHRLASDNLQKVSVFEAQQLSLFCEYRYEVHPEPHATHARWGLALIVLSWLPIALVIWAFT